MTLLVLGISHRSAPLRVLDSLALTQDEADDLAADLIASDVVAEAIVLATCNRIEVYAEVTRFHPAVSAVTDLLAKATGADRSLLLEHSYVHFDSAAIAHLFSVAAGLDSMVVGESQILGQVRGALVRGQEGGTAGRELNAAVQRALRVGKRAHAETDIDRSGVSLVSVALDAAAQLVGDLGNRRVMVVGAGSMGALALATLAVREVRDVVVANRSLDAAARLAATHPGTRWMGLTGLPAELAACDVVIFCTGAQDTLLDPDAAAQALARRGADARTAAAAETGPIAGAIGNTEADSGAPAAALAPMVILDLALPHDTDPAIAALPGVHRLDLAALSRLPGTAASEADVARTVAIVQDEMAGFVADLAAAQVEPTLISLRAHAGSVLDAEMARLRLRLAGADPATLAEVERSMRRAMATLLHNPTVRMKQLAAQPGGDQYAAALSALFDLDPSLPASMVDPAADGRPRRGLR